VGDAVAPYFLLDHGLHQTPRRFRDVGALQHDLTGVCAVLPAAPASQVHRTKHPLLERIVDTAEKPQVLLVVGDGKPVLDQPDAAAYQLALEFGHRVEEFRVLVVGTETRYPLNAGAVVPAAIETVSAAAAN
jgi:hypothetical protein